MITIVSFRRSGSTFLKMQLESFTGTIAKMTHQKLAPEKAICCIRDPYECLPSYLAMNVELALSNNKGLFNLYKVANEEEYIDKVFEKQSIEAIESYISFYEFLNSNKMFVVDFNNLTNNTELVIRKISDEFNLTILDRSVADWHNALALNGSSLGWWEKQENKFTNNARAAGHMFSSKKAKYYEAAKLSIKNLMDQAAVDLYNSMLEKSNVKELY